MQQKLSKRWEDFDEELLLLIEQVFPEFMEQASDVIALDHFLGQL